MSDVRLKKDGSGFVELEVCVPVTAGKSKTQKLYPGVYKPPFRRYTGPKIPVEYGVVPEIVYRDGGHGVIALGGFGTEAFVRPPEVQSILAEFAAIAAAEKRAHRAQEERDREDELPVVLALID